MLRLRAEPEQRLAGCHAGGVQLGQRAALYCRVSTADQSCERQERDLAAFAARAGYEVVGTFRETGSGARAARTPAFRWVNTALGNIKAAITGTYRSIASKHVPRYLAEFEYRFNRRYDLAAMLPRLATAALQTPPMPYRLLKLAEVAA